MEGHGVTTVTAPPFLDFPTGSSYTFPAFQAQRALDQRPAPLEGGWIGRSSALPGSVWAASSAGPSPALSLLPPG